MSITSYRNENELGGNPADSNKAPLAKTQQPLDESQTQPETQFFVADSQEELLNELKRKDTDSSGSEDAPKTKKAKISIGVAVDLGD